jgi:glyoxylase-like metal-dependent hydrolase (beta-lactamase superfamily II)
MDAPYAKLEQLEPGIARVLAHNPSAFTYYGTQTYLIGTDELAVIDPGPDLPEHVDALEKAIGGRPVAAIMCTHTHRDHSPAARPLAQRIGAPVIGCAPLALETVGPRADASFDGDYLPDRVLGDEDELRVDGEPVTAVATPGHTSNHLCFSYRGALFSGDHVMGWSTTVVVPPDGDMAAYMASLDKLLARPDRVYYPAHGAAIEAPHEHVRRLIAHRRGREAQILDRLGAGVGAIPVMVEMLYRDVDPVLHPAAGRSVLAHLYELRDRGQVRDDGERWRLAA